MARAAKGKRLICAVLAFAMASVGCVQNTVINTEPDNAEVWINGQYMGTTPVTYRSRSGFPDSATIRIEKEGYEPIKAMQVDKVLRADVSLLLLILAIVPYFFSARFEDNYAFKLKPITGTMPAARPAAPAVPTPPPPPPPPPPPAAAPGTTPG